MCVCVCVERQTEYVKEMARLKRMRIERIKITISLLFRDQEVLNSSSTSKWKKKIP